MIPRPPISTRTDSLFPSTTLCLSDRIASRRNVLHFEGDEITAAQLAVNGKIEQRQVAPPPVELKPGADRPDVLRPQRRLLANQLRSEEHTSELQSLMRISYADFWLKKKRTYTLETATRGSNR